MMDSSLFSGSAVGWHVHMVFGVVLFIGIIFLIIWAIRALDKKKIGSWTIWLLAIGIIGTLLTCSWGYRGFMNMRGDHDGFGGIDGMMNGNMMGAMWDDLDSSTKQNWLDHMEKEMDEHIGSVRK